MKLFVILTVFAALSVNVVYSQRWIKKKVSPKSQSTFKKMCLSGDGSSYMGSVSTTANNNRCLKWGNFYPWGDSKELSNHNYCRNPNQSLMPWCHVRRGLRIVKEFCNIPKCSTPTVQSSSAVDTELTCGERSERKLHKIVGGSFTPIESHPWIAAIYVRGHFSCGGSLIAPCWVVTAAHCFADSSKKKIQQMSVYLGKTATNETDHEKEQRFTVEKLILHPKYNDSNYNNDIALLKIKSRDGRCAMKSRSARTVCLPPAHTQLPAGFRCSIAGFGLEKYIAWHYSQYLKQAEVKLISQAECTSKVQYGDLITRNMFCAGSPDWSSDACKGDSGGPLVCEVSGRMFLFGVVSWGEGCALKNKPGVYTKVTNYNKWIAAKTGLSKYTMGVMYPTK